MTPFAPVRIVPLREVADLVTGATPPREPGCYGGAIPLFRPGDLPGDLDPSGPLSAARDKVTELGARHGRLLPPGTVLVSCIGLLGKVGLLGEPALTNQQLTAVIPRPGIVPEYVYYWAQTLRPWLVENASATTLPIVNQRRLGGAPFPLVPPEEQRRIVAELQAAQARHRRAAAALAKVPTLLAQLRRSLLERALAAEPVVAAGYAQAPDDRSSVPLLSLSALAAEPAVTAGYAQAPDHRSSSVPLVPLGSLAQVQVGYAFRSDWFAAQGVRLLRGVNIAPGALTWAHTAYLPEAMAARYAAYALRAGDIVVGLDRPLIAGGLRVARLGAADLPALLVQRVGHLRLEDDSRLDSEYLLLCLQSESAVRHLAERATGTQLPHISSTDLRSIFLPLPPLLRQRAIVEQTRAAWQRVAGAATQATVARRRLDALWQQLLRRAFGALGPGERADRMPNGRELPAGA